MKDIDVVSRDVMGDYETCDLFKSTRIPMFKEYGESKKQAKGIIQEQNMVRLMKIRWVLIP